MATWWAEGTVWGLLLALPWLLFAIVVAMRLREPWPLTGFPVSAAASLDRSSLGPTPHVSVIVPARNEARNIEECIGSLLRSDYGDFDVILVDDRSTDETAALAQTAAESIPHGAERLTILRGAPLPDAWFGKPWACEQGYRHVVQTRGPVGADSDSFVLFTDADTWHDPTLLSQSVDAFRRGGFDALTLLARQRMLTFWERAVQPHVFFLIGWRFGNIRKLYDPTIVAPARWQDAIANGQFIMATRTAYEEVGTHAAVAGEVVEDLRLAQEFVRAGKEFALLDAGAALQTRMYRSFEDLAEGWTKNLWTGSRQAFSGRMGAVLPWLGAVALLVAWVVPPLILVATLVRTVGGGAPGPVLVGAAAIVGLSVAFWTAGLGRFFAPRRYGWVYPVGAAVTAWLIVRSTLRGAHIVWKGREYGDQVHG